MEEKSNLENFISSLSENEQEKFKDLIEECRKRERDIREYSDRTKRNIQTLATIMTNMVRDINYISETLEKTNNMLQETKQVCEEKARTKFLEELPEDSFFKA